MFASMKTGSFPSVPTLPSATTSCEMPAVFTDCPSAEMIGRTWESRASRHHAHRLGCMTIALGGKYRAVLIPAEAAMILFRKLFAAVAEVSAGDAVVNAVFVAAPTQPRSWPLAPVP